MLHLQGVGKVVGGLVGNINSMVGIVWVFSFLSLSFEPHVFLESLEYKLQNIIEISLLENCFQLFSKLRLKSTHLLYPLRKIKIM